MNQPFPRLRKAIALGPKYRLQALKQLGQKKNVSAYLL